MRYIFRVWKVHQTWFLGNLHAHRDGSSVVEYAFTGSSGKKLVCSNADEPAQVGDWSSALSMHAFFQGGALTILSLDCLSDLTVFHVTCITDVDGPTFTTLEFPMTVSGCEAHNATTFDFEMPHCNTLNLTNCIGLGSSGVNPLGQDCDQVQMEPYQLQTESLRLAHKRCQNGPWATWTFPSMVRSLQIPMESYQIFLGHCIASAHTW